MNSPSYEQAKQLAAVLLKIHTLPTSDQVQEAVKKATGIVEEPDSVDMGLLCRDMEALMNIWVPGWTDIQNTQKSFSILQ